jgi:UDP-GlcNAc:undecaprenyl-phosphate GlcNAc-1-phosphate transferase
MQQTLVITALVAIVISIGATVFARWLGIQLGISDKPGGRRKHRAVTSRLGALPLFVAFVLSVAVAYAQNGDFAKLLDDVPLRGLLVGACAVFLFGLIDDKLELSGRVQFAAQACIATIPVIFGEVIDRITSPIGSQIMFPYAIAVVVTVLWFVGMMNTVNFTDGVDGLAGVMSLVGALTMAYYMYTSPTANKYTIIAVALACALIGFLMFNMQPASIFLGSGAQFLGFVLAYLAALAEVKLSLLLIVMSLPIADTAWQIYDRMRKGKNPMVGDRGHLHLRLVDMGWSPRNVCLLYVCVSATLVTVSLLLNQTIVKYVGFAGAVTVVILVLARLAKQAAVAPATSAETYSQGAGSSTIRS